MSDQPMGTKPHYMHNFPYSALLNQLSGKDSRFHMKALGVINHILFSRSLNGFFCRGKLLKGG
jgi:hypothetical protein